MRKNHIMAKFPWKTTLAGLAIVATTVYAVAQMAPGMSGPMAQMHQQMMQGSQQGAQQGAQQGGQPGSMHEGMHGGMGSHGGMGHGAMHGQQFGAGALPTSPGQDAFGAIQEVVQLLEADPTTDWSKVNISALREHLIDMNEVTLHAAVAEKASDTGIEFAVTGDGRTRDAILRMVPAHVHELAALGWNAKTTELPNGVTLSVAATDKTPLAKLKALGFIGVMVQGGHHQPHHLMMAKGEFHH
jgi:hypothetical protein